MRQVHLQVAAGILAGDLRDVLVREPLRVREVHLGEQFAGFSVTAVVRVVFGLPAAQPMATT